MLAEKKIIIKDKIYRHFDNSFILLFHHITSNPKEKKSGCILPQEIFFNIVNYYMDTTGLESVDRIVKNCGREKKIALTFDDGLADVYTIAYPFLRERNIPFTVYIVTGFLDREGYITTDQLLEMKSSGLCAIGVHGETHEILNNLSFLEKEKEMISPRKELRTLLDGQISSYAYSHGQYDHEAEQLAKNYDFAVTVRREPVNAITCRRKTRIPRINMEECNYKEQLRYINQYL